MHYNFTITLQPYGAMRPGLVKLAPASRYGYWEHRDGSEGGGLWFDLEDGVMTLSDFDGDYFLPPPVVAALRAAGYRVSDDCTCA